MRHPIAACAIVLAVAAAHADIAPNPLITGGATVSGRGIQGTPVAMTAEEVDIHPSAARNDVAAVFLLKNTADREATLEVGFPAYGQMPLKDFTVHIDGAAQEAQLKQETQTLTAGRMVKTRQMSWMTWPMTFKAGQERTVKVAYWVAPDSGDRWVRHEIVKGRPTMIIDSLVNVANTTLPPEAASRLASYTSGYVLHTGAGWSGTIGKAVIRVHYSAEVPRSRLAFLSPRTGWTYDDKADTDTLTLTDFEPTEASDIAYQFRLVGPAEEYRLLAEGLAKGQLDAPSRMLVLAMVRGGQVPEGLSPADRERLVRETLEYIVPPRGAAIDVAKTYPKLEDQIQEVFATLMQHYRDSGATERGAALAKAYQAFIDELVASYPQRYDPKWANTRTATWKARRQAADKYVADLATSPPAAASAPSP